MDPGDEVTALARRFEVPAPLAAQVDALGLLPREAGRLGPDAARRMRLLSFALSRGIDESQLLTAMRSYGELLPSFDELAPAPLEGMDPAGVAAEVGIEPELAEQILAAIGAQPGDPISADDVEAARMAKQALDLGLPAPVLLQLLRVFADNMERLAEAENRIFHDNVHEQFRAQGLVGRDLVQATSSIATGLQELLEPTVLYFHRRAWARAAQYDFLRHLTEDSRPTPSMPGASSCTVLFADLSGFTALTAAMGDDAAAEVLVRFGAAVRRLTAAHDGRVVKQIGDAFMLVFDERRHALACGVELLAWCAREPRFPPVHIGGHAGEVLFREGDFVGAVVNLAARVASATEPMQFLVTDAVLAELTLPPDVLTVPHPPRDLKGLVDPVALTSVAPASVPAPVQLDPVCGMSVGEDGPAQVWGERTWRFCSTGCEAQFLREPQRHAATAQK